MAVSSSTITPPVARNILEPYGSLVKAKEKTGLSERCGMGHTGVDCSEGHDLFVIIRGCNIRIKVWDHQNFFSDVQSFLKR